jgi:hypothetical protein
MHEKTEKLIKSVYRNWKSEHAADKEALHPDEEDFVSFFQGNLPKDEVLRLKEHFIACDRCGDILKVQIESGALEEREVPVEVLGRVKNLAAGQVSSYILEIILKFKEKALELLNTTGDILMGQELVPAAVLRSRQIKDFRDEINIFKDFKDIRVEVKIENKDGREFNLAISVKEKQTQRMLKDVRVALLKGDLEVESYLADSGKVTFEHVLLGKYTVEIYTLQNNLASILLDIKT